jgi:hypothetical protein
MLKGYLDYVNEFGKNPIETLHVMVTNHSLAMFFNCKQSSIQNVLKKPAARDRTEISFSQNLLDNFGFPHDQVVSTDELLLSPTL